MDRLRTTEYRGKVSIPFDFNIDDWIVVEDEPIGLDYAALPLLRIV